MSPKFKQLKEFTMVNQLDSILGLFICFLIIIQPGSLKPTRTLEDVLTKLNLISGEHEHIMEVLQEITGSKQDDKANFFLFLGLRIFRPKFLHFRKKIKILFLTFFIFSDVKKLPD